MYKNLHKLCIIETTCILSYLRKHLLQSLQFKDKTNHIVNSSGADPNKRDSIPIQLKLFIRYIDT